MSRQLIPRTRLNGKRRRRKKCENKEQFIRCMRQRKHGKDETVFPTIARDTSVVYDKHIFTQSRQMLGDRPTSNSIGEKTIRDILEGYTNKRALHLFTEVECV